MFPPKLSTENVTPAALTKAGISRGHRGKQRRGTARTIVSKPWRKGQKHKQPKKKAAVGALRFASGGIGNYKHETNKTAGSPCCVEDHRLWETNQFR